ncbi:hypothetical protein CLOM_g17937 [Closterium sp. NIES-68]|nr:hypothetical protein CLOM_g17937 [Closterium sp. NIES-68]
MRRSQISAVRPVMQETVTAVPVAGKARMVGGVLTQRQRPLKAPRPSAPQPLSPGQPPSAPPPLLAPSPPHSTLSLAPPSSPPSSPLHPPPPSSSLLPALSPSSLPASPVVSNSSSTPFSPSPPLALSPSTQRARARFLLYRLLGNDMAPLQCGEQLLRNTLYSLQHEPPHLPGCRRLWVLNHLVNATTQAATVKALKDHGVNDQDILIRALNLSLIATLDPSLWTIAVTAQNEARNFMLEHGRREGAQWVLAFDGNQFVTEEAWRLIVQAADRHEKRGLKVFKVPMYRVHQAQDPSWLNASSLFLHLRRFAPHLHESQVAFRGTRRTATSQAWGTGGTTRWSCWRACVGRAGSGRSTSACGRYRPSRRGRPRCNKRRVSRKGSSMRRDSKGAWRRKCGEGKVWWE